MAAVGRLAEAPPSRCVARCILLLCKFSHSQRSESGWATWFRIVMCSSQLTRAFMQAPYWSSFSTDLFIPEKCQSLLSFLCSISLSNIYSSSWVHRTNGAVRRTNFSVDIGRVRSLRLISRIEYLGISWSPLLGLTKLGRTSNLRHTVSEITVPFMRCLHDPLPVRGRVISVLASRSTSVTLAVHQ